MSISAPQAAAEMRFLDEITRERLITAGRLAGVVLDARPRLRLRRQPPKQGECHVPDVS